MNNDKTFSWKNVVQFGGAYIAFCIGDLVSQAVKKLCSSLLLLGIGA